MSNAMVANTHKKPSREGETGAAESGGDRSELEPSAPTFRGTAIINGGGDVVEYAALTDEERLALEQAAALAVSCRTVRGGGAAPVFVRVESGRGPKSDCDRIAVTVDGRSAFTGFVDSRGKREAIVEVARRRLAIWHAADEGEPARGRGEGERHD